MILYIIEFSWPNGEGVSLASTAVLQMETTELRQDWASDRILPKQRNNQKQTTESAQALIIETRTGSQVEQTQNSAHYKNDILSWNSL